MSNIKICLDAGHYGKYNQSPADGSYYESEMNWKLHLLLKKYLEEYGFIVTTTRADKNVNMNEYYRGTASKGSDLFISLHSNAVGSYVNENVDYPVVYVPLNGKGNAIGQLLVDCVESVMGTKQNGRIATRRGQNGDYYGVIRGAVAVDTVGLIIEHSFHTNTRATQWLLNDSNLKKLAEAEAKTIAEWFGVEKEEKPVTFTLTLTQLSEGAEGAQVKALQQLLMANGIKLPKYGADSDFGAETKAGVIEYQRKVGLSADGIAGPNTWKKLLGV